MEQYIIKWESVYEQKISNIHCSKLAEFNYKLLNNLIICGQRLNKWNKDIPKYCSVCNMEESPEHLLFTCNRVANIWLFFSDIVSFQIKWKHIVLGFFESNNNVMFFNLLFAIIARSIFVDWCKCTYGVSFYKDINLMINITNNIHVHRCLCKSSKLFTKWVGQFERVCEKL